MQQYNSSDSCDHEWHTVNELVFQVQMDDLRQQMGATLSERYTSQQKGTAKMMNDYEQMRKELGKVLFRTFFDL